MDLNGKNMQVAGTLLKAVLGCGGNRKVKGPSVFWPHLANAEPGLQLVPMWRIHSSYELFPSSHMSNIKSSTWTCLGENSHLR